MDDHNALARLLEQTVRSVFPDGGETDLAPGQWAVLRYLAKAGKEARNCAAVANYLGVTERTASRAVETLQRRMLVSREACSSDPGVVVITLSPAGRAILQSDPVYQLTDAIRDLQSSRLQDLQTTLEILSSSIANRSG